MFDEYIMSELTLFLSYSWKDSELANKIDNELRELGFSVKRDIRDVGTWKSIKEFMRTIREQNYVVLIISPHYLKSANCMYEVMELIKDTYYKDKIFSIVTDGTDIYEPELRVDYICYWQKKKEEMEKAIKPLRLANVPELAAILKQYCFIEMHIGEFLETIADKNNPQAIDAVGKIKEVIEKKREHLYEKKPKYEENIKINVEAFHYTFLNKKELPERFPSKIGIKKFDDADKIEDGRYLPMLRCEVVNYSDRVKCIQEPFIEGKIEFDDDMICSGMGFLGIPDEQKSLVPNGSATFNLYGNIIIPIIGAFLKGEIENIFVEDSFGIKHFAEMQQIENITLYFRRFCSDLKMLKEIHTQYF